MVRVLYHIFYIVLVRPRARVHRPWKRPALLSHRKKQRRTKYSYMCLVYNYFVPGDVIPLGGRERTCQPDCPRVGLIHEPPITATGRVCRHGPFDDDPRDDGLRAEADGQHVSRADCASRQHKTHARAHRRSMHSNFRGGRRGGQRAAGEIVWLFVAISRADGATRASYRTAGKRPRRSLRRRFPLFPVT